MALIHANAPAHITFRDALDGMPYGHANSACPSGVSTGDTVTGREASLRSWSAGQRMRW